MYWQRSIWSKLLVIAIATATLSTAVIFGVGQWYIASQAGKPYAIGATFIPNYAESLGVDPEQTLDAILNELGVRQLRLVSYWNVIEAQRGTYDYSQLDWQFAKAEAAGAKISLAVGLRQPRWPECHMPGWARQQPREVWAAELNDFIAATATRYKNSPALASYQLENEFFNSFGECSDFDRQRLIDELAVLKQADGSHPVIISRSNNYGGFALGQPQPDLVGISVYRRTWEREFTQRYMQYPFPSWYYAFLAGSQKILTGKDSVLHELQAEPWPPNGQEIINTSLTEQDKSLNAMRLADNVAFAKRTGLRYIDLWGAEYWYYRKQVLGDSSVWDTAKKVYQENDRLAQ